MMVQKGEWCLGTEGAVQRTKETRLRMNGGTENERNTERALNEESLREH
jgi:hypothetical protein